MVKNREIIFASRPTTHADVNNFQVRDCDVPPKPEKGQITVRLAYVSVDPYMRGRMNPGKSYIPGWEVGKNPDGGVVAEVVDSADSRYKEGDFLIILHLPWKLHQTISADFPDIYKLPDALKSHASVGVGVVGMPGLTAFLSLERIASANKGDVAFVSCAAGAVGTTVGQLLKLKGCKVFGSAGSDEKIKVAKDLGFDDCMNYKKDNLHEKLSAWAPDGIDIFFDNVGGETLEITLDHMKRFGRVVVCGAISTYDNPNPYPIKNLFNVTTKSLKMQGFIVFQWKEDFPKTLQQLADLYLSGKLKAVETIREGFDQVPSAFIEMLKGGNVGKMVVKV